MCSSKHLLLHLLIFVISLIESSRANDDDFLSIKPLPAPENRRPANLETADALLSDWEGQHFAALDADQDKVALSWTIEKDEVTFQVQVVTAGWFYIALTFRGSLIGADFIVGWISPDGTASVIDAHGNQFGQLIQDKSQDYELIVGYEYQGTTVIRFKRKINTCDGEDLALTNDTFEIHWSYGLEDPLDSLDLSTLVPDRSGVRSLHFFGSSHANKPRASTLMWTVQSNSLKLWSKPTIYWCTMTKLPVLPGKHQMIGYKPILSKDTEKYVHHMMLYECHDEDSESTFSNHVHSGYECNAPNMPDDFKKCKGIVAAWGMGGDPFYFPPEAGYPVGEEHGGSTYYMLEIHYDNPGLHDNVTDDSGLEIMLTPQLRKHDSGLLTIGHEVSSLHLIPPGVEHFTSVGHCPDLCTQSLADEGVRVFAGFPHTHQLGSSIRLRHLRDGIERPVPFEDKFYNPNYQTMRGFEIQLMPKDHLMIECTYNSSSRPGFTHGGYSAQNEMCLAFLHYYPASGLAHCTSRLSFKHILLALGINVWPLTPTTRNFGLRIRDPWQYQNLTFFDYLRVAASKDDTATNLKLQEASLHHSHKADCFDYGRRKIFADGVEFSTPRIHSPVYDVSNGCFSSGDVYDFEENLRLNQPLKSYSNILKSSSILISIISSACLLWA